MKKIVFSHNIPEEYYQEYTQRLRAATSGNSVKGLSRKETERTIEDADIFICIGDHTCDQAFIDKGNSLRIMGNMGLGYDNAEVAYAKKKGMRVLGAPRPVVNSTTEMTIGLMMSVCRGIVQYNRELRKDRVCMRQLFSHRDMVLNGKMLGVIGFGRIGQEMARKAYGLGIKIAFYQPVPTPDEAVRAYGAKAVSLDELLETSDVVTIHIPYTKETRHYIDMEKLGRMKETAYLINASRGTVINECALVDTLNNHKIKGATLNIHEFEPYISADITELPNIVITPHCCANIAEVRVSILHELLEGIVQLSEGKNAHSIVCRRTEDMFKSGIEGGML